MSQADESVMSLNGSKWPWILVPIGAISLFFVLRYCHTHHAKIGHNIKSRALKNRILYNLSLGGTDGTESYELDLPNGGETYVIGNVFQQGPETDNPTLFAYGAEGLSNAGSALYVVNNTFVNDRSAGTFISVAGSPSVSKVVNNFFVGNGTLVSGMADTAANLRSASPGFVDRAAFDYRITPTSPAVNKGIDPGSAGGASLAPAFEYFQPYQSTEYARLATGYRDANNLWAGTNAHVMVIMVNKRALKGDTMPKTWSDLAHPRGKDRLVVSDPETTSSSLATPCRTPRLTAGSRPVSPPPASAPLESP